MVFSLYSSTSSSHFAIAAGKTRLASSLSRGQSCGHPQNNLPAPAVSPLTPLPPMSCSQPGGAPAVPLAAPQPHRAREGLPGAPHPGLGEQQRKPAAREPVDAWTGWEDVHQQPGTRGHPGDRGHVPRAGHLLHHQEGQGGLDGQQFRCGPSPHPGFGELLVRLRGCITPIPVAADHTHPPAPPVVLCGCSGGWWEGCWLGNGVHPPRGGDCGARPAALPRSNHLCFSSARPAAVRGEHPGPDAGLGVRSPLQAQAVAQAEPEGEGALRPHAALAQRPPQRGEAARHEEAGEER